jgi:hypothetical protein
MGSKTPLMDPKTPLLRQNATQAPQTIVQGIHVLLPGRDRWDPMLHPAVDALDP